MPWLLPNLSPLWISLKVAAIATLITFFLGIAAAYWMLGYRGRGKSLIEGIFIAPLILPPTVVGFLLLLLFGRYGPLGRLTTAFNFSLVFTWYGAVIAATVVAFPLMYRTALGAFEQIDPALPQVASTLGAAPGRVFWQVILPLSGPGILAGLTLSFARALGEFGATLMLAGNIPGQTQTMPMAIFFAVEAGAMNEAWVWVTIILLVSLSGIVAVNFWQQQQLQSRRSTASPSDLTADLSPILEPVPGCRTSFLGNSQLWVDIEKDLSSFRLQVNCKVRQETLGILGASGSGKSMTLRCIAGVETPSQGQIVLNDRVLFDSKQGINLPCHQRRVGLVFQNYALFPHLTVAQNIAFGLQHLPKRERLQRVSQQLSEMHLEGLGTRYPHQLSGGQQQRVALARALTAEPEALLLDEPLAALDTYLRSQVERQLVETLSRYSGVTLFVTHNLEEVFRVCQRLMVMAAGGAIALGDKHALFDQPERVAVAQLTGCKNFSRAQIKGQAEIEAVDWRCALKVAHAVPNNLLQVGMRAHQIRFVSDPSLDNTFPCWPVSTSETPHRVTLYLRLHEPPADPGQYDLQAEVFKEVWVNQQAQPLPWYVQLAPDRLMLLE
ncbi:MAG: molybdate ABC transporter permease subunit [Cyanobacteria bacterium Co-bin8]|nr:molybdate ABC transporter permease subunit [Cyanobacteria bacterium Co-bin8]